MLTVAPAQRSKVIGNSKQVIERLWFILVDDVLREIQATGDRKTSRQALLCHGTAMSL